MHLRLQVLPPAEPEEHRIPKRVRCGAEMRIRPTDERGIAPHRPLLERWRTRHAAALADDERHGEPLPRG